MNKHLYTDQLWLQSQPIYQKMENHPFNLELARGSLSVSAFSHYLQQDEHYLRDYTAALTTLSNRLDPGRLKTDLEAYATQGLELEQAMHRTFFSRYQITPTEHKSLACIYYGQFLLDNARNAPITVALSALLPCFWFYWKVGQAILARSPKNNPYQPWIETYSGDEFSRQVETLLQHVNRLADQTDAAEQKQMQEAFITASLLELVFWDSAYQKES